MAGLLVDVQHALQAHNGVGPSPFHTLAKLLNSFLAWNNCGEMEEKWTDLLTGWKEIKKLYFFILLHFSILLCRCSHFYHEILGQVCHYTAWSCQMTSHIEPGLIFQELSYLKKHQQDEKTLENTNLIRSKHFVCTFLPFFLIRSDSFSVFLSLAFTQCCTVTGCSSRPNGSLPGSILTMFMLPLES